MSNVVREDIDNLNASLTITVKRSDYEPRFKSELSKYRKQAHMKGFRRGKTPMSVLKKMYGKGVLADVVNQQLQTLLLEYIKEADLRILGQPIPSDDQMDIEFDLKQLEDYVFKFDLGLAPTFEIQGMTEADAFERHKVEVTDKVFEEEVENAQKRFGEQINVTGSFEDKDLITLEAVELDEDAPKADGHESEFKVLFEKLTEGAQEIVKDLEVDGQFQYNIFEIEEGASEDYVKKYFLELPEEEETPEIGNTFLFTIKEATRLQPAAVDEELFKQWFNKEEITNLEQAREEFAEEFTKSYEGTTSALLYRDFQDHLMEKNQLPLPDGFLKRWIKLSNEGITEEMLEKEYEPFAKNLQWTLIRDKIIEGSDIKVTEDEVVDAFKDRIRGYFGGGSLGGNDAMIDSMAARLLEDEKQYNQIADEILAEKVQNAISEKVTVTEKGIDPDAFQEIVEKAQEAAQATQLDTTEEE